MKELTNKLRQNYQVMRSAESHHCISDSVTMDIKTFVRVYSYGDEKDHCNITFYISSGTGKDKTQIKLTSGDVFEDLKAKYFKPEMVSW